MKFLVKNCQITKKEKEKQMNDVIKRWKRGSRTDMVKENGKVYYRICKCGLQKESYKMPMCNACEVFGEELPDNKKRKRKTDE